MAKITGPLMSNSASGKIGERLVFSQRKSGQQVRFQKAQKDKKTFPQLNNRGLYGIASSIWGGFSASEKLVYKNLAKNKNISGYNYFIKLAIDNPLQYLGLEVYYTFNELTGATVFDYSKNGINATLLPTYPSLCPTREESYSINAGKSLYFSTSNNYLRTSSFSLIPPFFTVCTVFRYFSNSLINQTIISDNGQSSTSSFIWIYNPLNTSTLSLQYCTGTSIASCISTDFFKDQSGKWLNICITVDYVSKLCKFYRNGVFINEVSMTGTPLFPSSLKVKYLGVYSANRHQIQSGNLDDICLFKNILNVTQIKLLYKFLCLK